MKRDKKLFEGNTYTGQLTISVSVKCKQCGNVIESTFRRIPEQDMIWDCPVCKRVPSLRNRFRVRLNHPLVPKSKGEQA